ncbi:hypothetical protein TeGR_g8737 [Tetraparma gracilis]|uniref:Fe2OG dioxygenase domain-containing protein n=1 Tax=Tetraparma gracilis TaxID=2962635 RepID=A0ABQ6NBT9_9STRA|nr:hypothetical protein TeGR_g8737 [Tetraparma gracilis]
MPAPLYYSLLRNLEKDRASGVMYMKRRPSSTVAITKEDAAGAEWPSLFCQVSELAHAKADALEAQRACLEWALGSGEGAPLGKHAAASGEGAPLGKHAATVRRQGGTAEATLLAAPRFVNYTAKGQGVRMHADDNGHGWAVVLVLGDWSGGGDLVMAAKRGNVAIPPNSVYVLRGKDYEHAVSKLKGNGSFRYSLVTFL